VRIRIVVVGAGVAGCLIVQGLQQEPDVELICIEKGAEQNVLAGTGLNIGPNALKILNQFNYELAISLQAKGVSLPWLSWKAGLTDGTLVMDLPLLQVADNPGIRIRWSELYYQLRRPIAGRVWYNTTITAMRYAESAMKGPLELVLENQITGERQILNQVDLIVGCDGRYSQVRSTFFGGQPEPTYLRACIYRLLVPNRADNLIDDYQQWFHNGHRLLAFAIPGNKVYIAGSFPLNFNLDISPENKQPHILQQLYKSERGYSEVCQFLVNSICDHVDNIHWARIQEILPVFGDVKGHVICLGDSSHAMFPTLGQGATQAFEDGCFFVYQIRQCLAEARNNNSQLDVPSLIAKVEAKRRSRIKFVQQFSREASDSLLSESNPMAELKAKIQAPFLKKLMKLYRHTPEII
jgi:2-polyprenyl-6-methoxyphenol hydroxylase-like FAD-dependent oxidoreductase